MKPISRAATSRKAQRVLSPRKRLFFNRPFNWIPVTRPPTLLCRISTRSSDALPPAEALPKAREYAQEALRIDPDLPASHVSLAYVYFYHDWNWPAAIKSSDARLLSLRGLPGRIAGLDLFSCHGQPAEGHDGGTARRGSGTLFPSLLMIP